MRMIKYPLTNYDLELIDKAKKIKNHLWMVAQDIYEDMVAVLKLGFERICRYLVPMYDIYDEAASKFVSNKDMSYDDALNRLFEARRDIIEFAEGDLIKDLRGDDNMTYEEKVAILLEGMEIILEQIINSKDNGNTSNNSKGSSSSSGSSLNKNTSPYKAYGNILNNIAPPINNDTAGGGNLSGRTNSKQEFGEYYDKTKNKRVIVDLIQKVFDRDAYKLFFLAKNFNTSLRGKDDYVAEEERIGDTLKFRKMRKLGELKYIKKSDWALPIDIFDVKLSKMNFQIEHPAVKRSKNQLIYVLADVSGSMDDMHMGKEGTREMFMKSILISLGRNALETKSGKMWYRFFNDQVSPVYKLEKAFQWFKFMNEVLERRMSGGTNIHKSIIQANKDIYTDFVDDRAEIVLITDGTCYIEPEEIRNRVNVPIHAILLERVNEDCLKHYKDAFTTTLVCDSSSVEEAMEKGLKLIENI